MKKALLRIILPALIGLTLTYTLFFQKSPAPFSVKAFLGSDLVLAFKVRNNFGRLVLSENQLPSVTAKVRVFKLPNLEEVQPRESDPEEIAVRLPGHRGASTVEWNFKNEIRDEIILAYLFPQLQRIVKSHDVMVIWSFPIQDEDRHILQLAHGVCLLTRTNTNSISR